MNNISDAASGWAGWALAYREFWSSVNPITISGAGYAHHITASPPGFENPAASLILIRHCQSYNLFVLDSRYLKTIQSIDTNMSELVATQTTHSQSPKQSDIKLSLDWNSQLHKIKSVPVNFEKSPELTLALSSGGAILGKTLASKGASIATTKVSFCAIRLLYAQHFSSNFWLF